MSLNVFKYTQFINNKLKFLSGFCFCSRRESSLGVICLIMHLIASSYNPITKDVSIIKPFKKMISRDAHGRNVAGCLREHFDTDGRNCTGTELQTICFSREKKKVVHKNSILPKYEIHWVIKAVLSPLVRLKKKLKKNILKYHTS